MEIESEDATYWSHRKMLSDILLHVSVILSDLCGVFSCLEKC